MKITDNKAMHHDRGFTLAELLIALAILGVIATFAIPKVLNSQQDGKLNAIGKETAAALSEAYQVYRLNSTVTTACVAGTQAVGEGFRMVARGEARPGGGGGKPLASEPGDEVAPEHDVDPVAVGVLRVLDAGIGRQGLQGFLTAEAPPVQQPRQAEIRAGHGVQEIDLVVSEQANLLYSRLSKAGGDQIQRLVVRLLAKIEPYATFLRLPRRRKIVFARMLLNDGELDGVRPPVRRPARGSASPTAPGT